MSSLYGCINDGQLCSDAGAGTHNACVCDSGRDGQYCESFVSSSSSSDASTITIGSSPCHTLAVHCESTDLSARRIVFVVVVGVRLQL